MITNKDAVTPCILNSWYLFFFCTDHSGPGPGRTGEEAAVGLQGRATHLCHVPRELRVTPTERQRTRETGLQSLQDLPKRSHITYLSSWELEP